MSYEQAKVAQTYLKSLVKEFPKYRSTFNSISDKLTTISGYLKNLGEKNIVKFTRTTADLSEQYASLLNRLKNEKNLDNPHIAILK